MSEVISRLEQSADHLEVDVATALKAWQNVETTTRREARSWV